MYESDDSQHGTVPLWADARAEPDEDDHGCPSRRERVGLCDPVRWSGAVLREQSEMKKNGQSA